MVIYFTIVIINIVVVAAELSNTNIIMAIRCISLI